MSKAPGRAGDLLQQIVRQTKRSVRSAGPRYTPNVAHGAPNLVIETVSRALAALSGASEWTTEREELTQNFAKDFRGLRHLSIAAEQNETAEIEPFIALLRRSTTERPWKASRTIREAIHSLTHTRLASLLSGLNTLGRKSRTRALIVVDGVNEGNREGWSRACKTLIRAASRFQWVAVAL